MMTEKQARKQIGKIAVLCRQSHVLGFTIIESLMAIIVVSILLAAIAPVITLSVATRVQSRRIELASQAARAYIDGIRTGSIAAPNFTDSTSTLTLQAYPAPTTTGTLSCTANSYCTAPTGTSLYCLDFDGTGSCEKTSLTDMVVQAFRYSANTTATSSANTAATNGYTLGVRVYRANAFGLSTTLARNNATGNNEKVTAAPFTGGVGQITAPLVEMTTDINPTIPQYSDLCTRYFNKVTNDGCNN